MTDKKFELKGTFRSRDLCTFTKEIAAPSEKLARIGLMCDIGSKHRVKQRDITIESVNEVTKKNAKKDKKTES